jgi:predicted metal-dependent HD superfamily phosphohydrolase
MSIEDFLPEEIKAQALFLTILEQYQAPHRKYHNVDHIIHCFNQLDLHELTIEEEDKPIIAWAILFHDCIYEPGDEKNEVNSAKIAEWELIKLGYPPKIYMPVANMIILSDHKPETYRKYNRQSYIEDLFLDIDMSIMAEIPEKYDEYAAKIADEYTLKYPLPEYVSGRMRFLNHCMSTKHFFKTPYYQSKEAQVYKNIKRELYGK